MDAPARTLYAEEGGRMNKLKRCPFCGGEAEFYRTPIKTNGGWCDSIVVRCKECEARTNRVLYDNQKYKNDSEYDEAAVAWNTRKPVERVLERLEELRMKEYDASDEELELRDVEDWFDEGESSGRFKAYGEAIEIIKEEFGCES